MAEKQGGGQKVKIVILTIIILACLGFIVKQLMPKKYTYSRVLIDVETGKVFKQNMVAGKPVEFPTMSPYSKKNTAYPAYKCNKCGTIFAFAEVTPKMPEPGKEPTEPPPMPMGPEFNMPKCPKCGEMMEITVPEIPQGQDSIQVTGEILIAKPSSTPMPVPPPPPAPPAQK